MNKRIAATFAAGAVAAGLLAGCGTSSDDKPATNETTSSSADAAATSTTPPPAELPDVKIVEESAKTTETMPSMHIALVVTDLPEFPLESLNADVTNQPMETGGQAAGSARFRPTDDAEMTDTDFVVTGGKFYTKDASGKYQERGESKAVYDPAIILDKDLGLANVIRSVRNPKVEGREDVDGVPTVKVTGTISSAVIDPIMPTVGKDGGELPVTLWIVDVSPDEAPTTEIPQEEKSTGTGPNLVRIEVQKGDGKGEATFSKWAEEVTIPNPTS